MNRIKNYQDLQENIVSWIGEYCLNNNIKSLVIGVSGGIDSAVSSTLAASTGLPTYVIGMPIDQISSQEELSNVHLDWLNDKFDNE